MNERKAGYEEEDGTSNYLESQNARNECVCSESASVTRSMSMLTL